MQQETFLSREIWPDRAAHTKIISVSTKFPLGVLVEVHSFNTPLTKPYYEGRCRYT